MPPRKLLALDLDETLVHTTETELAHPEDFLFGHYFVYRRPHLSTLLKTGLLSSEGLT
jgi:carboxy-terminal domain RNA polymerase II polypeptide A small phosphatase